MQQSSWSVDCSLPFVCWPCAVQKIFRKNGMTKSTAFNDPTEKGVAGHFPWLRGGCEERNLLAHLFACRRRLWRRKRVRFVAFRPISTWRLGPTVWRSVDLMLNRLATARPWSWQSEIFTSSKLDSRRWGSRFFREFGFRSWIWDVLSWGNAWDSRWCRAQLSWKACPAEQHAPWPGRNQCNSRRFCWNSLRRVFLADKLGNSMTMKCADLQGCPCIKKARAWHRDCLYPGNCGMRTRYHSPILSTQSVSNMIFVGEGDGKKF